MRHPYRILQSALFCGLLTFLSSGCFHKDVMDDRADDILATSIYNGPEGTFILSWEEIFQATSKESGGGVTNISGYNEWRLSTYDLMSGELMVRAELGEQIEDANHLLGWTKGKIWIYGLDEELGLHYLNPKTLEVVETWPDISKKIKPASISLAQTSWNEIPSYFALDHETQGVFLTSMDGYRYLLDPETFQITKTERKPARAFHVEATYANSASFTDGPTFSLQGDTRKSITGGGVSPSFIDGEWVMDRDPRNAGKKTKAERMRIEHRITTLSDSIHQMEATYPELKGEPDFGKVTREQRERIYLLRDMRYDLEDARRRLPRLDDLYNMDDDLLLSTDEQSAYIRHASSLSDTAHAVISKVALNPDGSWTTTWTTLLGNIYHDANKADNAGAFETVFSKGNPSFDYTWAATDGKHLFIIEQLNMICLDLSTGKVVWEREM